MRQMVRRVTPMHIVEDVRAAGVTFAALGFEPVETGMPEGFGGWRASNGSHVVVAARALIAREFGAEVAGRIGAAVVPYVSVSSVSTALEELAECDAGIEVLAQALTSHQTVEAIVRTNGGFMLLAERLA